MIKINYRVTCDVCGCVIDDESRDYYAGNRVAEPWRVHECKVNHIVKNLCDEHMKPLNNALFAMIDEAKGKNGPK